MNVLQLYLNRPCGEDFPDKAAHDTCIDLNTLRIIILLTNNINSRDSAGNTALVYSIINVHQKEIIKLLVDQGADVNLKNKNGDTPLHTAVYCNCSTEIIKYLVDSGADINQTNHENQTPLEMALKYKVNKDIIRYLIELYSNRNMSFYNNYQLLYYFILLGDVELFELALKKDIIEIQPNILTKSKLLYECAKSKEYEKIIALIIDNGADMIIDPVTKISPLNEALKLGYSMELIKHFLTSDTDLRYVDINGMGPLETAIEYDRFDDFIRVLTKNLISFPQYIKVSQNKNLRIKAKPNARDEYYNLIKRLGEMRNDKTEYMMEIIKDIISTYKKATKSEDILRYLESKFEELNSIQKVYRYRQEKMLGSIIPKHTFVPEIAVIRHIKKKVMKLITINYLPKYVALEYSENIGFFLNMSHGITFNMYTMIRNSSFTDGLDNKDLSITEDGNTINHVAYGFCSRKYDYFFRLYGSGMKIADQRNVNGWTPLHMAYYHNNIAVIAGESSYDSITDYFGNPATFYRY